MIIFEHSYRGNVWKFQVTEWNGQQRLNLWPWYQPSDGGDLRPGKGGFIIPFDRLPELIKSLQSIEGDDA